MPEARVLLADGERFGGQRLSPPVATALGRADFTALGARGRHAQLARVVPRPAQEEVSIAALSRQADRGDAAGGTWLRADPAHLRADINGVRLLAYGSALHVQPAQAQALIAALQPIFDAAGYHLDAPHPERWYLRVPETTEFPHFPEPGDVVGDDLFEHIDHGPVARQWRALASEAQIVLHQHPLNQARMAHGQASINAIWFWGGGRLPDVPLRSAYAHVFSDDPTLASLASGAAVVAPLPAAYAAGPDTRVFDLEALRDLRQLEQQWLQPMLADVRQGQLDSLTLDMQDGHGFVLRRPQRLRVWRQRRPSLAGPAGPR